MYTERRSRLGGAVVWSVTASVGGRVLPDGCMDLIWLDDDLIVAGPDTCAFVTTAASPSSCTGLRFAPGTAPAVLGIPASELLNQRVPLSAIWPEASVRPLREHIRQAPARMRAALLEQVAAERLLRAAPPEPWCAGLVAGLRAGRSVADAARQVGFSDRQLQRRGIRLPAQDAGAGVANAAGTRPGPQWRAGGGRGRRGRIRGSATPVPGDSSACRRSARHPARRGMKAAREAGCAKLRAGGRERGCYDASGANRSMGLPSGSWTTA